MDSHSLTLVIRALERAALHGTVLPYTRFHALFSGDAPLTQRYAVLEAAVRSLSDSPELDYGVLLACDNGLPAWSSFAGSRNIVGTPMWPHSATRGSRAPR